MLNELKILFDNINKFKKLLNESVSPNEISEYIENHEWIYIYYISDDENRVAKGYRTIRPYVLGKSIDGNDYLLRAWQDNPKNSWHFNNKPTRKDSLYHDYWVDDEGSKPGWRLFKVSNITKLYPIGKKFEDSEGNVLIPSSYVEGNDRAMSTIISYVSTNNKHIKHPNINHIVKSKKDLRANKWDSIKKGNKNNIKITNNDIKKLVNIANYVLKKNKNSLLVVVDEYNNYHLINYQDKDKHNIPDNAIIGNLNNLYYQFNNDNEKINNDFFNSTKNNLINKLNNDNSKN